MRPGGSARSRSLAPRNPALSVTALAVTGRAGVHLAAASAVPSAGFASRGIVRRPLRCRFRKGKDRVSLCVSRGSVARCSLASVFRARLCQGPTSGFLGDAPRPNLNLQLALAANPSFGSRRIASDLAPAIAYGRPPGLAAAAQRRALVVRQASVHGPREFLRSVTVSFLLGDLVKSKEGSVPLAGFPLRLRHPVLCGSSCCGGCHHRSASAAASLKRSHSLLHSSCCGVGAGPPGLRSVPVRALVRSII